MGKHSKVSSSTKWRLGESVFLRLMECLTLTVFFVFFLTYLWITISHLFACLPTLELTTFEQQVCSTKIGYSNALSLGINICKKRNVTILNSAHQAKKQCNFDSGWLEQQQCDLHSFF